MDIRQEPKNTVDPQAVVACRVRSAAGYPVNRVNYAGCSGVVSCLPDYGAVQHDDVMLNLVVHPCQLDGLRSLHDGARPSTRHVNFHGHAHL